MVCPRENEAPLTNTLLVILLIVFVVLMAWTAASSVLDSVGRRRGRAEAVGEERFDGGVRVTAATVGVVGASGVDPAYSAMATRPVGAESPEQREAVPRLGRVARERYLSQARLGITHYIVIFIVASVLGLLAEELWMWVSQGRVESRVGVVWGPFSPLYGFGALVFTVVLWNFRDSPWYEVFLVSMGTGAAIEQTTGLCMEYFWHAQSWTYIGLPDAITQWICWTSVLLWGVLGVVYGRVVLPEAVWIMGEPSSRVQAVVVGVLVALVSVDLIATAYCFFRMEQRALGIAPQNVVDVYVDSRMGDDFIENRFENLVVGRQLDPNQ